MYTRKACREGVADTPDHRSKLLLVVVLICSARSRPGGILNELTFNGFAGDYD